MILLTEKEVFEFLAQYGKSGKPQKDLSRIASLLDILDNPQDGLRFIHVAGTNGKGSVCEMLTETLIAEGYRVGTFTSPYIIEYNDRIRINGKNIPMHYLERYASIVKAATEKTCYGFEFSQFEITMCIALLYFMERACDVVVWETGVGGRLDCTNIIKNPLVSIICSVSYDHTAILGSTIEEIANQKCGIIKENCPAVLSFDNGKTVKDIFERTCITTQSEANIPLESELSIVSDTLTGCEFVYKGRHYKTYMCGIHQAANATSVIEAVYAIRHSLFISQKSLEKGISRARIPARAQVLSKEPLIILDGSHNPDGFGALCHLLETKTASPRYILVGMLEEKESATSVRQLAPLADVFITTDSFHPKALSAYELGRITEGTNVNTIVLPKLDDALNKLCELLKVKGGMGVICGSLYLASEILQKKLP